MNRKVRRPTVSGPQRLLNRISQCTNQIRRRSNEVARLEGVRRDIETLLHVYERHVSTLKPGDLTYVRGEVVRIKRAIESLEAIDARANTRRAKLVRQYEEMVSGMEEETPDVS